MDTKILGKGHFSTVYLVDNTAIKKIKYCRDFTEDDAIREAIILKYLNNCRVPYIPQLYECYLSRYGATISMSYIPGQNFWDIYSSLSKSLRIKVMKQLTTLVRSIHRHGIIIGDIKPDNIIFDHGDVYLIDFGLSFSTHEIECDGITLDIGRKNDCGTLFYSAPELWNNDCMDVSDYSQCDVYSLGVIFHQMYTVEGPYPIDSIDAFKNAVLNLRPLLPNTGSTLLDGMILRMISKNPRNRCNLVYVKSVLEML